MIRSAAPRRGAAPRGGAAATTQVDGFAVAYQTSGNVELHRQSVVFIHGCGGDSRFWRRQLPFFAHSRYCIALDLCGHGRSEGNGTESAAAYAGFLGRFLDALAIRQPVVLVGHDLGGMVAMHLAATAPARVRALVLVAVGAALRVRPEVLAALGRGEPVDDLIRGLCAPDTPREVLREQMRLWERTRYEVRYSDFVACHRFDGAAIAGAIRVPTLIVGGEVDPSTPPQAVDDLRRSIADACLVLVPEAAHYPMLEQPEAFNTTLDAFLDTV